MTRSTDDGEPEGEFRPEDGLGLHALLVPNEEMVVITLDVRLGNVEDFFADVQREAERHRTRSTRIAGRVESDLPSDHRTSRLLLSRTNSS